MGRVKFGISDAFCIFFQDYEEENIAGYFSYRATRFSTNFKDESSISNYVKDRECDTMVWIGFMNYSQ